MSTNIASNEIDPVYKKYRFEYNPELELPILHSKEMILRIINENPIVVLQGATGCGKSTQVDRYLLFFFFLCVPTIKKINNIF